MRRTTLLLTLAATALLLSSTAAFAAIKIGTDGSDNIVGTNNPDHITGKGGDDTLEGKAGNDVYHFADGFGQDTLIEPKKVGKLPGGTDTVSFAGVTTEARIYMIPQYMAQGYSRAFILITTTGQHRANLGTSILERAVGGSGSDTIYGGAVKNTLMGGAGGADSLEDYGGWAGDSTLPALPASDDTYRGFAAGPGHDQVFDYGGTADVLDLRPWESSDVYLNGHDVSGDGALDTLSVSAGDRGVLVPGHFGPIPQIGLDGNHTMEKIVFADESVTSTSEVKALIEASSDDGDRAATTPEIAPPDLPE